MTPTLACLTTAQRRVAEILAGGKGYQDAAAALEISEHTVRNHVRQANDRLPLDFYPHARALPRLLMFYAAAMTANQLDAFAA